MNNPIKAAIGLASTGAVCAGGYFIWNRYSSNYTPKMKINSNETEKWNPINASSGQYEEGTMGNIYGNRLLDPFDVRNEKKWGELYQKIIDDANKTEEKEINSLSFNSTSVLHPFLQKSDPNASSLNKTCRAYYEKEIKDGGEYESSKIQIGDEDWKAFWMLCSMWSPVMLNKNSADYSDNSIGRIKGDELISTVGTSNEGLWKEKNTEFFSLSRAPTEEIFRELYGTYKEGKNENKLKEKCEEIYRIVPETQQNDKNVKADDAVKYCSMKLIS